MTGHRGSKQISINSRHDVPHNEHGPGFRTGAFFIFTGRSRDGDQSRLVVVRHSVLMTPLLLVVTQFVVVVGGDGGDGAHAVVHQPAIAGIGMATPINMAKAKINLRIFVLFLREGY